MPTVNKPSKVAVFINYHIEGSSKTQQEIATEVGFPRSNIISMLKQGTTKLPIQRVPSMAKALDADPVELFRLCMEEYMPDVLAVTDTIYGKDKLNGGESQLVERVRLHTGGKSFRLDVDGKSSLDKWCVKHLA